MQPPFPSDPQWLTGQVGRSRLPGGLGNAGPGVNEGLRVSGLQAESGLCLLYFSFLQAYACRTAAPVSASVSPKRLGTP